MTTISDKSLLQIDNDRVVTNAQVSTRIISTVTDCSNIFHWRYYLILAPRSTTDTNVSNPKFIMLDMISADPPPVIDDLPACCVIFSWNT